jgi:hypothetical protein
MAVAVAGLTLVRNKLAALAALAVAMLAVVTVAAAAAQERQIKVLAAEHT